MTSSLFLVRHGEAMPESQDSLRPLSPQGVKELEKLAKYLSAQNIQIDEILHSNNEPGKRQKYCLNTLALLGACEK